MNRREFIKSGLAGLATITASDMLVRKVATLDNIAYQKKDNQSTRIFNLNAEIAEIDIGAKFKAWTYNGQAPGPEIRVKENDIIRVIIKNNLPESTTIHWHGLPIQNKMDGVPNVTQSPIQPGESFTYEFTASPSGSYLYHSHVGYQLDRGLYGPLIVEPQHEALSYDREYTIILEDWATVDGGGPEASKAGRIRGYNGMMGRGMGMMGRRRDMMGIQGTGDMPLLEPEYDAYTVNGKLDKASNPFRVKKGDSVRLRTMNPSSSTIYTIRLAGHPFTITHTDGRPVEPLMVDTLRIGMGERYDVMFAADNPGRWALYTLEDGTPAGGFRLATFLYEGIESTSYSDDPIRGFNINRYSDLIGMSEETIPMANGEIDRQLDLTLSGGMMGSPYWTINGEVWPDSDNLEVREGERVRINYFNRSMMPHPMHLHGHFFEVITNREMENRIHKDTIIIEPYMGSGAIEFIANNPGNWFHHCHNLYHMMAGMADVVKYI